MPLTVRPGAGGKSTIARRSPTADRDSLTSILDRHVPRGRFGGAAAGVSLNDMIRMEQLARAGLDRSRRPALCCSTGRYLTGIRAPEIARQSVARGRYPGVRRALVEKEAGGTMAGARPASSWKADIGSVVFTRRDVKNLPRPPNRTRSIRRRLAKARSAGLISADQTQRTATRETASRRRITAGEVRPTRLYRSPPDSTSLQVEEALLKVVRQNCPTERVDSSERPARDEIGQSPASASPRADARGGADQRREQAPETVRRWS